MDRAAVRALVAKAPKDGAARAVDWADPGEDRAMRALLRLNGLTPENRPFMFQAIEAAKAERAASRAKGLALEAPEAAASALAGTTSPVSVDNVLNIGTNDWHTISAVAFSTYYGGSPEVINTINVFDSDGNSIADKREEQYGDGRILSVQSPDGVNATGKDINTLGTFFYIDRSTGKAVTLYAGINGGYYPKQVIALKPQITTSNRVVVVCLNRANPDPQNPTQCDYGPTDPNKNPPDVKIPFKGFIEYSENIEVDPVTKKPPAGTYDVRLYLVGQQTGGSCSGVEIGKTFMGDPNTVVSGKTISWDMEYANFGPVCYVNNQSYTLTFALSLSFNRVPVWATITNDPTTRPSVSTLKIPPLQIQYGCVLEGTDVIMAGGAKRKIEDIKIGDLVEGRKGPLRVNSTTIGWDFEFVDIHDSAGDMVAVTPNHPVVTGHGLVKAEDLKRGDKIYTGGKDRPASEVTEVERRHETKARHVFNLMLTEAGKPPADPVDANFYAGNILVGDAEGQRVLMEKPADVRAVRARLPEPMRVDYDNWLKEQGAQK